MSKVRLIDIYNERFNEPTLKLSATADIEVVPRRMVEMIIERCSISEKLVNKTTAMEVRDIRNYAESLLRQFEED